MYDEPIIPIIFNLTLGWFNSMLTKLRKAPGPSKKWMVPGALHFIYLQQGIQKHMLFQIHL
jgi:hypothetical protein